MGCSSALTRSELVIEYLRAEKGLFSTVYDVLVPPPSSCRSQQSRHISQYLLCTRDGQAPPEQWVQGVR